MSALLWSSPRSSPSPIDGIQHRPPHQHPHQVAFGAASSSSFAGSSTVNATASPFSLGFGFGGAGHTAGIGFASTSTSSTSPFRPGSGSSRRRRRSDSAGDERETMDETCTGEAQPSDSVAFAAVGNSKRPRREIRTLRTVLSTSNLQTAMQHEVQHASGGNEVDLGKALASLTKPALLSVLTSLLTQQPSLKPVVLSLLPAPSLESFTATLATLEKKVLDALPFSQHGSANLRDEYVWSRIRAPLEEYISETRLALGQFCPPPSSSSSSSSSQDDQQGSPSSSSSSPTTTFSFLYTLTSSVRKLEVLLPRAPVPFGSHSHSSATLPQHQAAAAQANINNPFTLNPRDPLLSFLPALFNQWHILATRLSTLVNQNGRVLSAESVRTWFRQLDVLVNLEEGASSAVGRKASEAVRERFVKELGWLVGVRIPQSQSQSQPQPQSVQAMAAQMMDSKMLADDDDEEEEEESDEEL